MMAREDREITVGNIISKIVLVKKEGHSYNTIMLERHNFGSLELRSSDIPKAILALYKTYEYLTLFEPKDNISQEASLKE